MQLAIHFAKHGHKFGAASQSEYERMADEFLFGLMDRDTSECLRPSGADRLRFRTTNRHFGVACTRPIFVRTFYPVEAGLIANHGGAARYFTYECGRTVL